MIYSCLPRRWPAASARSRSRRALPGARAVAAGSAGPDGPQVCAVRTDGALACTDRHGRARTLADAGTDGEPDMHHYQYIPGRYCKADAGDEP